MVALFYVVGWVFCQCDQFEVSNLENGSHFVCNSSHEEINLRVSSHMYIDTTAIDHYFLCIQKLSDAA